MGSAIAKGLIRSTNLQENSLYISDVNEENLSVLNGFSKKIKTTTSNIELIENSDVIILAVKPWLINSVCQEIKHGINLHKHIIVSLAAGVDITTISNNFEDNIRVFSVIPNTAIEFGESVSIISSYNSKSDVQDLIVDIFSSLGKAYLVSENQLNAYMSLSSCGIAYALRYIRAAMEGGIEMGIPAQTAKEVVVQTLKGAISLLEVNNSHPEVEIDKVTTPGGITIKGLNEMEANGFTNSVIKGLKASHIK